MITTSKILIRTIAAAAMLVPVASPAIAHDGYYGRGYGYAAANANHATNLCTRAVQGSIGYRHSTRARVTEIRDVDRIDRGYVVRGRVAVTSRGHWRHDDIGYRHYDDRRYDEGGFKCRVEYGRVTDLDFSGIRGL